MEVKKTSKANLESRKRIFFEIGLIITLACILLAFEWRVYMKVEEDFITVTKEQIEEEIIPITQQMMRPPPPPPPAPRLTDLIEIVDNDVELDDALEIQDAEADVANQDVANFNYTGDHGNEEYSDEAEIFVIVEDMPKFSGGDINKWLKKMVKYPMIAQENNIQGKVFIQFVIEKDGSVTDVKIARSVDQSLDKEAIRVIKSMPKWTPGKQRGKPVRVSYTVPINFQLQ